MFSLIITVSSIALLAVLLMAGMNYVNTDMITEMETTGKVRTGFIKLSTAFLNYRQLNQSALIETNWTTVLTPQYGFMPNAIANTSWSYENDSSGQNFCLVGSVTESQYKGIEDVKSTFSSQAYFVSSTCGVTENFSEGSQPSIPTTFPATVAATYWLTR